MSSEYYINLLKTITLENKYATWYINICERAMVRMNTIVGEKHHIVPKCLKLGGEKDATNMVLLTHKEHYVCHHLLTRMFNNKKHTMKMFHAFTFFSFGRTLTSKQHETAKKCRNMKYDDRNESISSSRKKTTKKVCKFCNFSCDPGNYEQFHGDKCLMNPDVSVSTLNNRMKPRNNCIPPNNVHKLHGVETTCPHCLKMGTNIGNMHAHHFDNCKHNPNYIYKPNKSEY